MASWNLSLQLNKLINQINAIGEYVGYLWNFIPVNGITITNNNTTVTSPNGNNTQYCYSSNSYLSSWNAQATVGNSNTNMFIGITTDVNKSYDSPSSPSMKMIDYGILINNQGENPALAYLINQGSLNQTQVATLDLATIKMSYSSGVLNMFVDNVLFFNTTETFENVYLVVGSFYGGVLNNISWSGSGSSGNAQTLADTLAYGDDANNLNITNVNNLNVNQNITGSIITANNYLEALGYTICPLYNGVNNNISLAVDSTHNKAFDIAMFQDIPQLNIYNQSASKIGRIFDNTFYTPSNSYNFNFTSTTPSPFIFPTIPKSIIQFPINKGFTSYNLNITEFEFDYDDNGTGVPLGAGLFQFYITDIKDDIAYNQYGNSFITPDISQTGKFISLDNIILDYTNINSSTSLYLNVVINYNNGGNYDLNNIIFKGQLIGNISPINTIQPTFTT